MRTWTVKRVVRSSIILGMVVLLSGCGGTSTPAPAKATVQDKQQLAPRVNPLVATPTPTTPPPTPCVPEEYN